MTLTRRGILVIMCLFGIVAMMISPAIALALTDETIVDVEEEGDGFVDDSFGKIPDVIVPYLQVQIPGLDLKNTVIAGTDENGCEKGFICTDIIARYLNAMFRWAAGAGVAFTIVLVMIGGVQYMTGSATGQTQKGLERMRGAAIGLVILLSVSAILTFVNPAIALLKPMKLEVVEPVLDISIATRLGGTPTTTCIADNGDLVKASGTHVDTRSDKICSAIVPAIATAADRVFQSQNKETWLASGYRTPSGQAGTWYGNCYGKAACDPITCDPFPRKDASPVTHESGKWLLKGSFAERYTTPEEIIAYLKQVATQNPEQGCPHLTGYTMDIWCGGDGGDHTVDPRCHVALEEALRAAGFCRLYHEGWHFEYRGHTTSGTTDACDWLSGRTLVAAKYCKPDQHPEQAISSSESRKCVFDYSACPKRANLKQGKCVD